MRYLDFSLLWFLLVVPIKIVPTMMEMEFTEPLKKRNPKLRLLTKQKAVNTKNILAI